MEKTRQDALKTAALATELITGKNPLKFRRGRFVRYEREIPHWSETQTKEAAQACIDAAEAKRARKAARNLKHAMAKTVAEGGVMSTLVRSDDAQG
jgi:hypothetical protein